MFFSFLNKILFYGFSSSYFLHSHGGWSRTFHLQYSYKRKSKKEICFWVGLFLGEILLCMAGLRYFTKIVINLPKRSFTVNERLARFLGTHRGRDIHASCYFYIRIPTIKDKVPRTQRLSF